MYVVKMEWWRWVARTPIEYRAKPRCGGGIGEVPSREASEALATFSCIDTLFCRGNCVVLLVHCQAVQLYRSI